MVVARKLEIALKRKKNPQLAILALNSANLNQSEPRKLSGLVPGSSPGRPNTIMAWVHILRGASGRYYFGSTDDLERRIAEHQRGDNLTARRFGGTIELVACRELPSIAEARKLEIALKRKKNPKLAVFMLQSPGRRRHGWATCKARR